jgi:hypothetical protein
MAVLRTERLRSQRRQLLLLPLHVGTAAFAASSRVLWQYPLSRCPRIWPACRPCHHTEDVSPWDQCPGKWMLHGITRPRHHHYRWCSMETKRAASIYPTVDEINALPEKFRRISTILRLDAIRAETCTRLRYCVRTEMHCSSGWRSWRPALLSSKENISKSRSKRIE